MVWIVFKVNNKNTRTTSFYYEKNQYYYYYFDLPKIGSFGVVQQKIKLPSPNDLLP